MVYMQSSFQALRSHMQDIGIRERNYTYIIVCRWTYRILPTVVHQPFEEVESEKFGNWITNFEGEDKKLHVSP